MKITWNSFPSNYSVFSDNLVSTLSLKHASPLQGVFTIRKL